MNILLFLAKQNVGYAQDSEDNSYRADVAKGYIYRSYSVWSVDWTVGRLGDFGK